MLGTMEYYDKVARGVEKSKSILAVISVLFYHYIHGINLLSSEQGFLVAIDY